MESTRNFTKSIVIERPIAFIDYRINSRGRRVSAPKVYLTTNLFYAERDKWKQARIVTEAKRFLLPYFGKEIPKLTNLKLTLLTWTRKKTRDLDNWEGFWKKLILDLLKTPTANQKAKAFRNRKSIITLEVLEDDNVKFVTEFATKFMGNGDKMEIILEGRIATTQKTMELNT